MPPGQLLEVKLRGDPAVKRRGAAAVLLLDGALVAYGGAWEEEDTLQLPAQSSGSHTLTLGVVSDTGGDTWKRESDLCTVQWLSFVVEDEAERGQPQPPSGGALGAITWPRNGARLLASEVHLLRFELVAPAVLSLGCNGVKRREALPYEAGPHETTLDFLADCTAGAAGGDAAVEMLLWDDAESGGGGGMHAWLHARIHAHRDIPASIHPSIHSWIPTHPHIHPPTHTPTHPHTRTHNTHTGERGVPCALLWIPPLPLAFGGSWWEFAGVGGLNGRYVGTHTA